MTSAPRSIRRCDRSEKNRTELSLAMKRGLRLLLDEGPALAETGRWRTTRDRTIALETLLALYDRYLVKIVIENRRSIGARRSASLTEIGTLAAERLSLDDAIDGGLPVSREAMLLIGAITEDNFESSPNVYPEEREAEGVE